MKASELIEILAKYINEHGDCKVYTWNSNLMNHIPIESVYFVGDYLKQDLDDEDYIKDFKNIYHNIVIN